jgi:hypothetical protein
LPEGGEGKCRLDIEQHRRRRLQFLDWYSQNEAYINVAFCAPIVFSKPRELSFECAQPLQVKALKEAAHSMGVTVQVQDIQTAEGKIVGPPAGLLTTPSIAAAAPPTPTLRAYGRAMVGLAKLIVGAVAGIMVARALWVLVAIIQL